MLFRRVGLILRKNRVVPANFPSERILGVHQGIFHSNRAEDPVMTIQPRSMRLRAMPRGPEAIGRRPAGTAWLGRLIQVALGLYLIPALLVVLLVGGIGMLVLAVAWLFTVAVRGRAGWPRTPVGPASLSS